MEHIPTLKSHKHRFKPHWLEHPFLHKVELIIVCETCGVLPIPNEGEKL